jgi:hypothetical protein
VTNHPDKKDIFGMSGPGHDAFGYLDGDRWRLKYKTTDEWLPPTVQRTDADEDP